MSKTAIYKSKPLDEKIYLMMMFEMFSIATRVGRNVAAGMTGGLAYLLDEDDTLLPKVSFSL